MSILGNLINNQGNKPKKFTKKTNFHNPTLNSFLVTGLFNPEVYNQFIQKQPTMKLLIKPTDDTLTMVENQFSSSRILQRNSPIPETNRNERSYSMNSRPSNKAFNHPNINLSPSPQKKNLDQIDQSGRTSYRNLNYLNSESIKRKQLHGYNILSGF